MVTSPLKSARILKDPAVSVPTPRIEHLLYKSPAYPPELPPIIRLGCLGCFTSPQTKFEVCREEVRGVVDLTKGIAPACFKIVIKVESS